MSELDKKLETLVGYSYAVGTNDGESARREKTVVPQTVEKIKQAFIDDGWVKDFGTVELHVHNATNVMTGQEWYDKFIDELVNSESIAEPPITRMKAYNHYLAAAKRASGIKDNE